jgi:cysteine desulfurase
MKPPRKKQIRQLGRDNPGHASVVYLDHNATTPLDPRVLEAMQPFLTGSFGNASSRTHAYGQAGHAAVEQAREEVSSLLGGDARGVIWTSGATESVNLAIKGVAQALRDRGRHIITQATEHPAVLDCCEYLRDNGYELTVLPVDAAGLLSADNVLGAIRKDTILVSIMYANNETGVIQPVREVGQVCKSREILFHTDATQAVGKIPVDVKGDDIDLLSLSAHKFCGPKGVGALYVRPGLPRVRLLPQMHGGGHERGMRSGTLNVPGIVGFGTACELSARMLDTESRRIRAMRDRLEGLLLSIEGSSVNGHEALRLPNTTSVCFEGIDAEAALVAMPGLALSTGSACTSTSIEPSHVLTAMGLPEANVRATLRLSLGRTTSDEQLTSAVQTIRHAVSSLRAFRHA